MFVQARRLICDRLASVLSLRSTPPTPTNDDEESITRTDSKTAGNSPRGVNRETENTETGRSNTEENSQALTSILSLLETRITIDNKERMKNDKTAKMRRDWMLAAAVIDRLCFVVLLVIFVGGTLLFLGLFLHR